MLRVIASTETIELEDLAERFRNLARSPRQTATIRAEAAVIAGCIEYFANDTNAQAIRIELDDSAIN